MQDELTGHILTSRLLVGLAANGLLATFGAIANYLYVHVKSGGRMKVVNFFTTAFLGFFVGNLVGNFLPSDFPYRDGTLLVAGFACYPILGIIETKIPGIFERKIDEVVGSGKGEQK